MSNIPKSKHALRRICSIVLSKDRDNTTIEDIDKVRKIFQDLLNSGYSPKQIKEKYNITYSDFGMFLKNA